SVMAGTDRLIGEGAAWRHYTMTLDLLTSEDSKSEEESDEEEEEVVLHNKLLTCTDEGVLAMIAEDMTMDYQYFRCFNLQTRCEITRLQLPSSPFILLLAAVDSTTIVAVGHLVKFEYFSQRKERKVFATIFRSVDGFRSVTSTDVLLSADSDVDRRPRFCVSVGDGFVIAMGHRLPGRSIDFLHVPFADLCCAAVSHDDPKSLSPVPVGSIAAIGAEKIFAIPYDHASFALLRGDSGNNRIEVYDIKSHSLRQSISVAWSGPTDFPPPVVVPLPFDGFRGALLQLPSGAKLKLNVQTGAVESRAPFVSPSSSTLKICLYPQRPQIEPVRLRRFAKYYLSQVDGHGEAREEDAWPSSMADAVYLKIGRMIAIDGSIIGDFTGNLRSLYVEDSERITVLRVPIDRVHSLATLASNTVIDQLSREFRMRITMDVNPKNIPDLVKAILR
ncbi:hypothetical protein PENTCL1PPCAC_3204, partial [Pristionchus entomophagus]